MGLGWNKGARGRNRFGFSFRRGLYLGVIDVEDSGQGITHQDVCMLTKVTLFPECWTLFLLAFSSGNRSSGG